MALSKRERWLLKFALILLAGFILTRWVLLPAWNYFGNLKMNISEGEHSWEMNQLLLADGDKYLTLLQEARSQLTSVEMGFYHAETNQVRLKVINQIDSMLKDAGLELKNKDLQIITSIGKDERELNRIRYRGELKGQLPDLVNFLQSLNRLEKLYQVKELEIRGGVTESSLTIYILIEVINTGVDKLEK